MRYSQYKYKFYLNANHSITLNDKMGQVHPHTWEIMIDIVKIIEEFVPFYVVEKTIDTILAPYQDKYINEIEPFNELNPTLENISEYFKDCIEEQLKQEGWLLLRMEISETPARSYVIDAIYDSDNNGINDIYENVDEKIIEEKLNGVKASEVEEI
ncbi:MAG: 6-carboxytetrahydropterin synthase [Lachnospiraceae bacterium]|nr:6-carboxytetrahydropterin synthase [Lachnospiraceae bacterium]